MRPDIVDIIRHALSVGSWLQNFAFYFLLLLMAQVVMFQSKLSLSRLRSGIAEEEIE